MWTMQSFCVSKPQGTCQYFIFLQVGPGGDSCRGTELEGVTRTGTCADPHGRGHGDPPLLADISVSTGIVMCDALPEEERCGAPGSHHLVAGLEP